MYPARVLYATAFMLGYQANSHRHTARTSQMLGLDVTSKIRDIDEIDGLSKSILPRAKCETILTLDYLIDNALPAIFRKQEKVIYFAEK